MTLNERTSQALRWAATCVLVCWGLLTLDNWAAAGFATRPYQEIFYDSRLAVGAALLVFVPWLVAYVVELGLPRARWIAGVLCVLAAAPLSWDAAAQLAEGDGVVSLKLSPHLVRNACVAVLSVSVLLLWWLSRALRMPRGAVRAPLELLFAVAALCGLGWFAVRYVRTYEMLSPFVLGGMAVLSTSIVARVLSWLGRFGVWLTAACLTLLSIGVGLGFALPSSMASGRRSVLADEGIALYVDPLLFQGQTAAVRFDISHVKPGQCTSQEVVKPWPKLLVDAKKRRNVILLSVDALRADAVGKLRNGRSITPNLDRFLREARTPRHAYTTYPATLFALSGAMDGLLPSEILFAPQPPKSLLSLARTKVDVVDAVLPSSPWFVRPAFERYVVQGASRRARAEARLATDEAIRSLRNLRRRNRRHLYWVHYLEPHQPYVAHPEFPFGDSAMDHYDAEVATFDRELGRLLDVLRSEGWYDDSLIVFFSDHGQALGERNYFGHHVFLNRWIGDIPFAMYAPGTKPGTIAGPVQITDVAATAMHFLDITPPYALSGESLLAADPPATRGVFSEAFPIRGTALFDFAQTPLRSIDDLTARIAQIQQSERRNHAKVSLVKGNYRLIVQRTTGTSELYDLRDGETREQSEAHPEIVERMLADMAAWHAAESRHFFCDFRASTARKSAPSPALKGAPLGPGGAPVPVQPGT